MSSQRVNRNYKDEMYFITLVTHRLYYLFDRHNRWEILLNSLKYYQEHKRLNIFNWVFMLNHIHLIVKAPDIIGFIRDFKTYTSKELKKNILITEPNILKLFIDKKGEYHFWKSSNMPKLIETEKFYLNKANYIESNPVRKLYVRNPEDWIYTSANYEKLLDLENALE